MVDQQLDSVSVGTCDHQPAAMPSDILIADDDELLAKGLMQHVEQLGFNVVGPASDGLHAIELAQKHEPSLALLDIRMPVLDGIGAASIIFPKLGIPVVMVSAHSDATSLRDSQQAGIFGYLVKPVALDQLRASITVAWASYCQHLHLQSEIQKTCENY